MAEAILKRLVAVRPDAVQWHIASAGTWARYGAPASVLSQQVVQGMGLDISDHQSQPVTLELVQKSDLILTMESQQKEGLILQYGPYAGRIYMLSEMVGRVEDVPDPVGGVLADYQSASQKIESFLSAGLDKIQALSRKGL